MHCSKSDEFFGGAWNKGERLSRYMLVHTFCHHDRVLFRTAVQYTCSRYQVFGKNRGATPVQSTPMMYSVLRGAGPKPIREYFSLTGPTNEQPTSLPVTLQCNITASDFTRKAFEMSA